MTPRRLTTEESVDYFRAHAAALGELARGALDQTYDLAADFAKPFARIFVAERDAVPFGFLVAWHVADELHVLAVAVDPAERRRGYGRELVRIALEYARDHGIAIALLEVRGGNEPAIALYRSFGFETTNVRRGYYRDGEDALELTLTLTVAGQP